jgi:hypothetical protein
MTTTHELAEKQNRYVTAEGKYIAKVKAPGNGWLGTTKNGTDFIRVPLLIDEPLSSDQHDQHGREIVWQGWLTEKATKRTCDTLDQAFGREWDIKSLDAGKSPFLGQKCRITVEAEEYNGQLRHKIKWLNPLESKPRETEPLSSDRLATLNERLAAARASDDEISF